MLALDLRFRWALPRRPKRTLAVVAIGLAVFLVWDLIGIATGIFVKGDGPWYVGVMLAPHLPLEEIVFLTFLSYLACVVDGAVQAYRTRSRGVA